MGVSIPPHFANLASELVARICTAGGSLVLSRLSQTARETRAAVAAALTTIGASQGELYAGPLMAHLPPAAVPRALRDLETAGELVAESEPTFSLDAVLEVAAPRFANGAVCCDVRSDAQLREVALAHGLRLCPGLGTMITRMAHANAPMQQTTRRALTIESGACEGIHSLGHLRVSGREGPFPTGGMGPLCGREDVPYDQLVGDVVLYFVQPGMLGDQMMAAWHFLVGAQRRAWLLVRVDCRVEPLLRKATGREPHALFTEFRAPSSVFACEPDPRAERVWYPTKLGDPNDPEQWFASDPGKAVEAAARKAEEGLRSLEEALRFWTAHQARYLPTEPQHCQLTGHDISCSPSALFEPRRGGKHLPRCLMCFRLCEQVLRCGKCKRVYFCSVEHQRECWEVHKKRCLSVSDREKFDKAAFRRHMQKTNFAGLSLTM